MLEKVINEGIGERMEERYETIFKLFLLNSYVVPSDLSTYTSQNFKRFLGDSFIERKWASETYNNYRRYLKCYCGFLKAEWFLLDNPFDLIKKRKTPTRLPKTLKRNEVTELLANLSKAFDNNWFIWERNRTIVPTFLYTGLRLSELMNLKLGDLQIHDGYIKVLKWKGSKDRIVPLSKDIVKILIWYLRCRRLNFDEDSDAPLFPTIYWNHLQKRDLRVMILRLREVITFYFTWHQLRHTFATELVRNNFDIYNISKILGHSKIDTTKIYLSVDTNRLKIQLDNIALFA